MNAAGLLARGRVVVPLSAKTLPEAVRILIEACVADGKVRDPERLNTAVSESWPEDTLSMGPNAFLPHFRSDAVAELVVALGVAPTPLRRQPKAPREARIVLLVIAPPGEAAAYLQAIAAFARALAVPEVVAALHEAASAEQVLAIPALAQIALEGQLMVRDIMTRPVVSVGSATPLGEAAQVLMRHQFDALPVVGDRGEVVGLITHGVLLRHLLPGYVQRVNTGKSAAARKVGGALVSDPGQLPVKEVMLRNVICVDEDQTLADAATLLANKDLERVPVVFDGVLTGMLTRSDIVRKLLGRV